MSSTENGFLGLGIAPGILEILTRLHFITPTPIQSKAIGVALEGKDVMGIAQTGTGKTLAFGIPLIQQVLQGKGLALVIAPTRELALQIEEAIEKVGRPLGVKSAVLIGGESILRQFKMLSRDPHIIIGTPGRIIDHVEQRTVKLGNVKMLVLDEADRMLDMGFAPQLKRIVSGISKERQTMLFSATMPTEIVQIAREYLRLPLRIEVARAGSAAKDVSQELFFVPQEDKARLLEKVLQDYHGSVLVFTRTKHGAKRIALMIRGLGHTAAEIHSNRSLNQRRDALEGFKTGAYRVLVATDVASRGIDVKNIELVINFDLPENAEDYVHRIGRTGRAGDAGHAISFACPNQRKDVYTIERLIQTVLPISKLPELPKPHPIHMQSAERQPHGRFFRKSNGRAPQKFSRPKPPRRRFRS